MVTKKRTTFALQQLKELKWTFVGELDTLDDAIDTAKNMAKGASEPKTYRVYKVIREPLVEVLGQPGHDAEVIKGF